MVSLWNVPLWNEVIWNENYLKTFKKYNSRFWFVTTKTKDNLLTCWKLGMFFFHNLSFHDGWSHKTRTLWTTISLALSILYNTLKIDNWKEVTHNNCSLHVSERYSDNRTHLTGWYYAYHSNLILCVNLGIMCLHGLCRINNLRIKPHHSFILKQYINKYHLLLLWSL